MKKILALFIIAAMMICAIVPVSAEQPPPAGLAEEVYHTYQRMQWAVYEAHMLDVLEQYPDRVFQFCTTYEEYCERYPAEDFDYFDYIGTYADGKVSVWVISLATTLGVRSEFVGNYWINTGSIYAGENNPGLAVYADGKLIYLPVAYEQGIIDDDDLAAICAANPIMSRSGRKAMYRIGDMDGNDVLDVADIMGVKEFIMTAKNNDFSDEVYRHYGDFDKSGTINVGDIMALKNHIMQTA